MKQKVIEVSGSNDAVNITLLVEPDGWVRLDLNNSSICGDIPEDVVDDLREIADGLECTKWYKKYSKDPNES